MTTATPTTTLVTFLLDRTGSMAPIADDTVGGFNTYLETLQKSGEAIAFSLVQFDSMSIDKLYVRVPVAEVPALTRATYVPRGSTPLIDAAYKTIKAVEASIADGEKPKVIICIQTDGEENCSTEHTWDELNALIKAKSAEGWQFNFMGASIDAYQQAQKMGLSANSAMSYNSLNKHNTQAAFAATASNAVNVSKGLRANTQYDLSQRMSAGDAFVPDALKTPAAPATPAKPKAVDDLKL